MDTETLKSVFMASLWIAGVCFTYSVMWGMTTKLFWFLKEISGKVVDKTEPDAWLTGIWWPVTGPAMLGLLAVCRFSHVCRWFWYKLQSLFRKSEKMPDLGPYRS